MEMTALTQLEDYRKVKNLDYIIALLRFVDNPFEEKTKDDKYYIEQEMPALESEINGDFNYECGGCVFSWLAWFWSDTEKDKLPLLVNTIKMKGKHFENESELNAFYDGIQKKLDWYKVPAKTHGFIFGWHKTLEYLMGISTPAKNEIFNHQLYECGAPPIPYGTDKWSKPPYMVFQELRTRHKEYAGK